jgi:dTDP-4-amino-4,6-dideoxygalactose transaminase
VEHIVARDPPLDARMLVGRRTAEGSLAVASSPLTFPLARYAIFHATRAFGLDRDESVLVPAYHCATAVEPILRAGARVAFYNVRRDCVVDLDDVRRRIAPTTKALLIIHYFGFPQPMADILKLCRDNGLLLLEDCAHVLSGSIDGRDLGSFGDASVFSWRKFLPLCDGGQLQLNGRWASSYADITLRRAPSHELRCWKTALGRLLDERRAAARHGGALGQAAAPPSLQPVRGPEIPEEQQFEDAATNRPMSLVSKRILSRAHLGDVVARRRTNYEYLHRALRSLPSVAPCFPAGPPHGGAPLALPVLVAAFPYFHKRLRAAGVPAVAWDGVIHSKLPLDAFPDAAFLYRSLILLPVHQGLGTVELDSMVRVVERQLTAAG